MRKLIFRENTHEITELAVKTHTQYTIPRNFFKVKKETGTTTNFKLIQENTNNNPTHRHYKHPYHVLKRRSPHTNHETAINSFESTIPYKTHIKPCKYIESYQKTLKHMLPNICYFKPFFTIWFLKGFGVETATCRDP